MSRMLVPAPTAGCGASGGRVDDVTLLRIAALRSSQHGKAVEKRVISSRFRCCTSHAAGNSLG